MMVIIIIVYTLSTVSLLYIDCVDGDVRLMGDGDTSNEGSVEVCVNSLWGMIAQSRWSVEDGQVVCRQLGLTVEGTVYTHWACNI